MRHATLLIAALAIAAAGCNRKPPAAADDALAFDDVAAASTATTDAFTSPPPVRPTPVARDERPVMPVSHGYAPAAGSQPGERPMGMPANPENANFHEGAAQAAGTPLSADATMESTARADAAAQATDPNQPGAR